MTRDPAIGALCEEITRAIPHLAIGAWRALVVECAEGALAIAPAEAEPGFVTATAARGAHHGHVRRLVSRPVAAGG